MAESTELEHLQDGLHSEFWRHFSEHVTREWGPAGLRYQQAVQEAAKSSEAVMQLRMVLHTQEQILALMKWPAERMSALKAKQYVDAVGGSRRGPGL